MVIYVYNNNDDNNNVSYNRRSSAVNTVQRIQNPGTLLDLCVSLQCKGHAAEAHFLQLDTRRKKVSNAGASTCMR